MAYHNVLEQYFHTGLYMIHADELIYCEELCRITYYINNHACVFSILWHLTRHNVVIYCGYSLFVLDMAYFTPIRDILARIGFQNCIVNVEAHSLVQDLNVILNTDIFSTTSVYLKVFSDDNTMEWWYSQWNPQYNDNSDFQNQNYSPTFIENTEITTSNEDVDHISYDIAVSIID